MTDYEKMVKAVSPPQDFQSTGKGMTDSEILDEVYKRLMEERHKHQAHIPPIIDFIEREWQKADEEKESYDMKVL